MKVHTTNYFNTLIEIAEDCPINYGEVPPTKGNKKSVANLQFEMLFDNPYKYTSDDIFFEVFAFRKEVAFEEMEINKINFFSKGQPCFRASPLSKRYGWGVHSDKQGKVAMLSADSDEYNKLLMDESVVKKKAMRTKRIS